MGRFRSRRPGGRGTFSNFELRAPEVAVLGLLAVFAKKILGALRAQSEGQGNLSMHPQGDNLYGYGPTTHFLAYFRLVLGATNTPPAPRFRPVLGVFRAGGRLRQLLGVLAVLEIWALRSLKSCRGNF